MYYSNIDNGVLVNKSGSIYHYKDGTLHRLDGPAVELSDGYVAYYINGKRHREEGPARVWDNYKYNPKQPNEWYFNGKFFDVKSQQEFLQQLKLIAFI